MLLNNEQAVKIDDYINDNKDSVVPDRMQLYELNGKRRKLPVHRLPRNILFYNIKNGRFAAELRELEATEGRRLDPEKEKDRTKIEELLLQEEDKAGWLKQDLLRVGQLSPATITHDGYIINGNRRAAVLNLLKKETGQQKFDYLEVVRLPPEVKPSDLWRFEAGFQLAQDLKVDYGPVNELLKIQEGKDYQLDDQEIARILGGDNTKDDVTKKIRVLRLIESYLTYFGQEKRYSFVKGKTEHFIDIDNIIQSIKKKGILSAEDETKIVQATFYYINHVETAHLKIREIGHIVKDRDTAIAWADEVLTTAGAKTEATTSQKDKKALLVPPEDEIEKLESKLVEKKPLSAPKKQTKKTEKLTESPAVTPKQPMSESDKDKLKEALDSAIEKVKLDQQKRKPEKILKRVETNLEALKEIPDKDLKPYSNDLDRINKLVKLLVDRVR